MPNSRLHLRTCPSSSTSGRQHLFMGNFWSAAALRRLHRPSEASNLCLSRIPQRPRPLVLGCQSKLGAKATRKGELSNNKWLRNCCCCDAQPTSQIALLPEEAQIKLVDRGEQEHAATRPRNRRRMQRVRFMKPKDMLTWGRSQLRLSHLFEIRRRPCHRRQRDRPVAFLVDAQR